MDKNIIYKLKGMQPVGWQLPLKEVLIEKVKDGVSVGLRNIKYVPGTNSYFAEDISGQLKNQSIWFERGQLIVPRVDTVKNALLQAHPWFNVKYEIWSKELEDQRKLQALRVRSAARKLIEESDSEKLKAISLALFGSTAFSWSDASCELELLQYAEKEPESLQKQLASKNYESKYLSALAFSKDLVKTNPGKTAIMWNDTTEGVIIRLAKGERGIDKLGEFLAISTPESELVIQAIGERLDKQISVPDTKVSSVLAEKDAEIAKLKAMLAKTSEPKAQEVKETKEEEPDALEAARSAYEAKLGKPVPNSYKNNLEWINSKL